MSLDMRGGGRSGVCEWAEIVRLPGAVFCGSLRHPSLSQGGNDPGHSSHTGFKFLVFNKKKKMKIDMMIMCEQPVPCIPEGCCCCCRVSEFLCLPEALWGKCAGSWPWPCVCTCVSACVLSLTPSPLSILSCLCFCHPPHLICGWHLSPVMGVRSPWCNTVICREETSGLKGGWIQSEILEQCFWAHLA